MRPRALAARPTSVTQPRISLEKVIDALPGALLAEGYLRALRPWQDKWE